jgi:hypothetical protein
MIVVLGISLILVDSLYLLNLVKKEGFLGVNDKNDENDTSNNYENDENDENNTSNNYENDENDENDENNTSNNYENYENDTSNNLLNSKSKSKSKGKNETVTNRITTISDEESDEETNYLHDKSIIKKMKQLNPIILETLKNMNSVHIKELNESINNLTDKIDP